MSDEPRKPFNKVLCNWLINDLKGLLKKHELTIENCGIEPEDFHMLIRLHYLGFHAKEEVRAILEKRLESVKSKKP